MYPLPPVPGLQVLGWYHSHPHITVWPSHVDVGTQADYQLMDSNFIGLIFSCFNDNDKVCAYTYEISQVQYMFMYDRPVFYRHFYTCMV